MTTETNKPIKKLYDGKLSLPIYKNTSQNGFFYSIGTVQRSYDTEDGSREYTTGLSRDQILRGQRLMGKAYDAIEELKAQDRRQKAA